MIFICEECRHIYTEEQAKKVTDNYYDQDGNLVDSNTRLHCPTCDTFLLEAKKCPACDRVYITEDDEICEDCLNEAQTVGTCLQIGETEYQPMAVNINGFLAFVYDKDEIERCILNDFEKLPKDTQLEYINRYLNEDRSFLADWLKEKREKDNADIH